MITHEKQLRLLLVSDFFYPHWTGISKSVFSLTQTLQNTFCITVLTVRFDKKLPQKERIGNVSVVRSYYLFTISRSKYSLAILWDFLGLLSQTDCVLINSPSSNVLFFSLFAKVFGKKLLLFHQGDLILPPSFLNKIIEKIFDLSCFISFSLADRVSTYTSDYAKHSRVIKSFLNKFTPMLLPVFLSATIRHSGLSRIDSGVTIERFSRMTNIGNIEKLRKEKKIIFGFAGRFVEEKGFDILFRAIPQMLEKLPDVHFVIAGQEMSYEDFFGKNKLLFDKVKNHVTFLGLLDDQGLKTFYESIDAIVVPSRSDCFNLVQAEAMLCGTPAIVSDIPGLRYLVKESGFGLTFKSESPEALAEAIIRFVKEKPEIMKNEKKLQALLEIPKLVLKAEAFITK